VCLFKIFKRTECTSVLVGDVTADDYACPICEKLFRIPRTSLSSEINGITSASK